jgi:hypothetical protein
VREREREFRQSRVKKGVTTTVSTDSSHIRSRVARWKNNFLCYELFDYRLTIVQLTTLHSFTFTH